MTARHLEVRTTLGSEAEAQALAVQLVERRLAACAQVWGPITSTYWWSGTVETETEWMCVVKTRDDAFGLLATAIRELHPYDTPEVIAVPVTAGDAGYLAWIDEEVRPDS